MITRCPATNALMMGLLLAGALNGQGFNYPNFASTAGLSLNGSAAAVGNVLQITGQVTNQAGSVWYSTPVPISGGFDTVFTFRITSAGTAADGMTFALHNDALGTAALGASGGALGYQGLSTLFNSLVIEFDTYPNGDFGEAAGNMVSIHANGSGPTGCHEAQSLAATTPPGLLANGLARQARVEYLPSPGTLNFYLDNLSTPLLTIAYSFTTGGTFSASNTPVGPPNLLSGMAYVGFTGGTGGLTEINAVESWTWASMAGNPFTLVITQPQGAGSLSVQLTNGPAGQPYLTAITLDSLNAAAPGQGYWGGLHISFFELYALVLTNQVPFVGFLDAVGASTFTLASGLSGPYPPAYLVSRTFGPGFATITATSNLVTVTLL